MIGIIDYGMGNLHSVEKALNKLGSPVQILHNPEQLTAITALVLPGVGAFDPAMQKLQEGGWVEPLQQWVLQKKPLLGICLGLQLLFEASDEGCRPGLRLLPGRVAPLPDLAGEPKPHMGWAPLQPAAKSVLFNQINSPTWMYFVHSFAAIPTDPSCITAYAPYGNTQVVAAVGRGQLQATQFHPEKSGTAGLLLLQCWLQTLS
jgi:glutamine amidotransferase